MKISKLFFLIWATLFISNAKAQSPQSINYQAVVRDAGGVVVPNKAVTFRLSILTGGSTGNSQYIETHSAVTNAFGLVTLNIGLGTPILSTMSTVTWGTGSKFLRVEVDINGGTNFSVLGTTQFLSVPYALYAATSGNNSVSNDWALAGNSTTSTNFIGTTNADDLRFNTNGSQKMVIKTDGNIGIGTTRPTSKLTIEATGDGLGAVEDRILMKIDNKSTSNAASTNVQLTGGNSSAFTMLSHISPTYTVANQADYAQLWNTGKGIIIRASPSAANPSHSGNIRFFTGFSPDTYNNLYSNERLRIEANGNVGIGTRTPTHRLRVETNSDETGSDDRVQMQLHNASNSREALAGLGISSGNTGTNTWLEHVGANYSVYSSAYPDFNDLGYFASTGRNGIMLMSYVNTSKMRFAVGTSSNIPVTRMTLSQTGLGVGTETPKAKIEVANGDVYVSDATKGIILKSPNGNCWRVTVDNTGNFVRTAITCPQ